MQQMNYVKEYEYYLNRPQFVGLLRRQTRRTPTSNQQCPYHLVRDRATAEGNLA